MEHIIVGYFTDVVNCSTWNVFLDESCVLFCCYQLLVTGNAFVGLAFVVIGDFA